MDLGELLVAITDLGLQVEVAGSTLRVGPKERITPELAAGIREHKAALLAAKCERCGLPTGGYAACSRHDPFSEAYEPAVMAVPHSKLAELLNSWHDDLSRLGV